jgi:hypothetical protein
MVANTMPWHVRYLFILINKKNGAKLNRAAIFMKGLRLPVSKPVRINRL